MTKKPHRTFGRLEIVRLWLSYQRYALAFFVGAVTPLFLVGLLVPRAWYLWIPALFIATKFISYGVVIYRRFPRKLQVTALAVERIKRGSFRPIGVQNYVGDPCYRVVANEILWRAGIARSERRKLIAEFRKTMPQQDFVLLVDRTNGVTVQVGGSLAPNNGATNIQLGGLVNDVSATGRLSATGGLSTTGLSSATTSGHPSSTTTLAPESTGSAG